jgi:hypothetical protein
MSRRADGRAYGEIKLCGLPGICAKVEGEGVYALGMRQVHVIQPILCCVRLVIQVSLSLSRE